MPGNQGPKRTLDEAALRRRMAEIYAKPYRCRQDSAELAEIRDKLRAIEHRSPFRKTA